MIEVVSVRINVIARYTHPTPDHHHLGSVSTRCERWAADASSSRVNHSLLVWSTHSIQIALTTRGQAVLVECRVALMSCDLIKIVDNGKGIFEPVIGQLSPLSLSISKNSSRVVGY
ncbi:unnamed protein product [Arctia plantaginis]|uniref:Uncharacterized protein n=1 Tax=Arctia plantaginis TaxID=874455 RepID=A0A8S0ZHP0_ARCPL|nr:unnamed protein product [Arctia plantaginis]